jgi:hypothetical protein
MKRNKKSNLVGRQRRVMAVRSRQFHPSLRAMKVIVSISGPLSRQITRLIGSELPFRVAAFSGTEKP